MKARLRFGAWAFDSESRELLGPAGAVHLLHDRLWAGTFVSDSNLAGLVKEIRRALGDPARRPAFLRTVHGFGYSFARPSRKKRPSSWNSARWLPSRSATSDAMATIPP